MISKKAVNKAFDGHYQVMIYSGHSFIGGSDGVILENLRMNKSVYQIMFHNGCDTYRYKKSIYFHAKKSSKDMQGTKNLDVILNGFSAYFLNMGNTVMRLINDLLRFESWDEIISDINTAAGNSHFTGVVGIQDNPKAP